MNYLDDFLNAREAESVSALVGLDGFVDEIIHVVKTRTDSRQYTRIENMREFGERIQQSSGVSTNFEFVPIQKKPGGNGIIMALGMKRLGAEISYLGCLGAERIDPIFSELSQGARLCSIADPGHTQAIEFYDGKLICSKLEPLNSLTWETIMQKLGAEKLCDWMLNSDLICLNNWSMIPHMNEIWQGILERIVPMLPIESRRKKTVFFDFADPQKRSEAALKHALGLISDFQKAGFYTVLGLNKKEASWLLKLKGEREISEMSLRQMAETLFAPNRLDCLVIHTARNVVGIQFQACCEQEAPFCEAPRITTGAGDSFNAGFMYALVHRLPLQDCLRLGIVSAGFYIRNAQAADRKAAAEFYRQWRRGEL